MRPGDRHERGKDRGGGADRAGAVCAGGGVHARSAGCDPASDVRAGACRFEPGGRRDMSKRPRKAKARRMPPRKAGKAPARVKLLKPDPLGDFILAAARVLDLKIEKSWMPAVRDNLAVTLRFTKQ